MKQVIDILMIAYNRPRYTKLSLERLLATCDENMRVWVWMNGDDKETLEVVQSCRSHPCFFKFHHSLENKKLREPTNWLWTNAEGGLLSKVDDDCLMPFGWADTLRHAHADVPEFGVIGCWHFLEDDFLPELASKKIRQFAHGHRIMQNCHVGGSGYLMKRRCIESQGILKPNQSFTAYCVELAAKGWINGWYYPFLHQEHMDDPRSPRTLLKTDDDFQKYMPLTARNFGVSSIEEWVKFLHNDAAQAQASSINPKDYVGWRAKLARLSRKITQRI